MVALVLIVDDDPAECRHIESLVRSVGYVPESLCAGEDALQRLARTDAPPIAAMILDLVMPELDGMAVLERLQRQASTVPVIVQAAADRIDAAASALRAGAVDYLVKPAVLDRLKIALSNALKFGALESEILRMRRSRSGTLALRDIVFNSPVMDKVSRLAERAARNSGPVLIEGARGVGKELLARAIHGSSVRRNRPFVVVGCSSIRETHIDAVLFGDEAGSEKVRGRFSDAAGGTLYLDEIGALPEPAQEKLAAVLANGDSAGSTGARPARGDVRLIAATARRLIELVSAGTFREDLFYRLSIAPIWIPPLRERRADLSMLARNILARLAAEEGKSRIGGLSAAVTELLLRYDWPGNIRELEHAMFRAVMLCEGGELSAEHFPQLLAHLGEPFAETVADQKQSAVERPRRGVLADMRGTARYGLARLLDEQGELRRFEALEEEAIRFAIRHCRGQMSEVARRLGIGRSTLYRKIKGYGIAAEEVVAS
jgi:DNA-binding NtrC family response regulator